MFVVHDDMTIYATRGDVVYFSVEKKVGDGKHLFQPGDVVRIKVYEKKNCSKVVLIKDFVVEEETTSVNIFLEKNEMKFGEIISKPKDYWYEVELNPDTFPDTFIGYNEDGPALFKLFPEGKDVVEGEIPDPEENAAVSRMVVHFVSEYLGDNAGDIIREELSKLEYVESIVREIIQGGHVDTIIREMFSEEHLETIVQEIIKENTIEAIVQEIIKGENIETIIQEILSENSIETIIKEIVKPGNIETIIKELMNPVNIDEIVDKVVEKLADRIPGAEVDNDGNITINGASIEGVVRSVNNILPDKNGNVNVGGGGTGNGTVTSVNGINPDSSGNVIVPIPEVDATLSKPGAAADAQMTGTAFMTVGAGLWEGTLSIAETLAALIRKPKHIKVTEGSSSINVVETMEDDALLNIAIALDDNKTPTSITVNGYTFPVEIEWGGIDG